MTKLYLLQQSTPENKCAAYASIYLYMIRENMVITEETVNEIVMRINDEVIIDTKLATEVVHTMVAVKNNIYSNFNHLDVSEIAGGLESKIKSNPDLTRDCLIAIKNIRK